VVYDSVMYVCGVWLCHVCGVWKQR